MIRSPHARGHRVLGAVLGLAVAYFALGVNAASAQEQARDLTAQSANVHRASGGEGLTSPSGAAPATIVAEFLRSVGHGRDTVSSLRLTGENPVARSGLTHLRFGQEVDGLQVYGTYVKAAVNGDGELVHLIENLAAPSGGTVPATAGPRDALDAALGQVHPDLSVDLFEGGSSGDTVTFGGDDFFYRDPTVTRVAIVMAGGALHEGYLVETWSDEDNLLHHTLVGGNGRVLGVQLRTNNDSYKIFPDHPGTTPQAVMDGPGTTGNTESPDGWLDLEADGATLSLQSSVDISGNNAHAYLDTDANNAPDSGGSTVGDGIFGTTANLIQEPETPANKAVAVQNLFYLNNALHDKLYRHGFTEGTGNFQEDNFGIGGAGSDSVNAEAQDGSGTNNANFSTPSDGSNPRMQMFVWTQSTPKRDGDVDSDIVYHEYGHGLTWRMIGNMSGSMSGAIGEGMSDVLAILINDEDRLAEYSTNDPIGIRSEPYTNYSRDYGDMGGNSVHFDGEIYAATIWHLWGLFQAGSVSQDTLFDYLIGGMNFTPSGPAMEDMRDGILQAAAGSGDECLIWEAFAAFGIGEGARGRIQGGGPFGGGRVRITESFDVPAVCSGTPANASPEVTITAPENGLSFDVGQSITFTGTAADAEDGDIAANLVWTSNLVVEAIEIGASFSTSALVEGVHTITATVTDSGGADGSATITITVGTPPATPTVLGISPAELNAGESIGVTIVGSGFVDGAVVTFVNGSGPAPRATAVNVVPGDQITATVSANLRGKKGSIDWDLLVTNPDGGSGTLANALTVNR